MTVAAPYLVGRGISDVTGELAGCGLLGYGKADQVSAGLHTRLRTRAFVFVDPATGDRVLSERERPAADVRQRSPRGAAPARRDLRRRLHRRQHDAHRHAHALRAGRLLPPPALQHDDARLPPGDVRRRSSTGIVEAVDRAHADIAPATLTLSPRRAPRTRASTAHRSRSRATRRRTRRTSRTPSTRRPRCCGSSAAGRLVGAINWFATHGTSMTNRTV